MSFFFFLLRLSQTFTGSIFFRPTFRGALRRWCHRCHRQTRCSVTRRRDPAAPVPPPCMGSMSHWHLIHLWRTNELLGESGDGVLQVKDGEDGRRAGGRRNWRGLEENTLFSWWKEWVKKKKNPRWGQEVTYCAQAAEQSNCQLALAPTVSLSGGELIVPLPQLPISPPQCDVPTNRFRCHFTVPEHDCRLYCFFFIWKLSIAPLAQE